MSIALVCRWCMGWRVGGVRDVGFGDGVYFERWVYFSLGGDVALGRGQRCVGLVLVAFGWIC